jgi:hypothetical protein
LSVAAQVIADLQIVTRPIAELKFSDRRVRRHPEKQLVRLPASIQSFGFNCPVLIDETGTFVAGQARVVAAGRGGLTHLQTITLSHLDPAKLRAYKLADNKLAEGAEWDFEVLRIELAELHLEVDFHCEAIGFDSTECDIITVYMCCRSSVTACPSWGNACSSASSLGRTGAPTSLWSQRIPVPL